MHLETGIPLDNCAVYLLDSSKNLVSLGEIGELYVAGSHICSGYVRSREMERFVKNHIDDTTGKVNHVNRLTMVPRVTV